MRKRRDECASDGEWAIGRRSLAVWSVLWMSAIATAGAAMATAGVAAAAGSGAVVATAVAVAVVAAFAPSQQAAVAKSLLSEAGQRDGLNGSRGAPAQPAVAKPLLSESGSAGDRDAKNGGGCASISVTIKPTPTCAMTTDEIRALIETIFSGNWGVAAGGITDDTSTWEEIQEAKAANASLLFGEVTSLSHTSSRAFLKVWFVF
jgi:hypothetical protein